MKCTMKYETRDFGVTVYSEDVTGLTLEEKMMKAHYLDKIYPPDQFVAIYKYDYDDSENSIHNFSNN